MPRISTHSTRPWPPTPKRACSPHRRLILPRKQTTTKIQTAAGGGLERDTHYRALLLGPSPAQRLATPWQLFGRYRAKQEPCSGAQKERLSARILPRGPAAVVAAGWSRQQARDGQAGRKPGRRTDRRTDRGTGRQTDRRAGRQAGRQEDKETDRVPAQRCRACR